MLATVHSSGVLGIDGYPVYVECSAWDRIPHFELVGLPDAAVKEAKNRVQSAMENSGISFPALDIMVNLAPADRRKEGSGFDLAILLSILLSDGILPRQTPMAHRCFVGELSLSGEVRPIRGVLSMTIGARDAGMQEMYVPCDNVGEASVVEGIRVFGVRDVRQLLAHLRGEEPMQPTPCDSRRYFAAPPPDVGDFSEVRGQYKAKRALEIAAAGGHNVLLIGPPGAGKSMLAKRLPTILPDMSFEEALETTKIHSVSGTLHTGLITQRPFRSPHHTVSAVGFIGGGTNPRPGEISLAHGGVLFLDELPEFPHTVTEALRQPLEDGQVTVTRAMAKVTYPASFMLVCAMNPCRCGYYGDATHTCTCSPTAIRRYLDRVSGPLLDRIDIEIELPAVSYDEISGRTDAGDSSATIRERVERARTFSRERMQAAGVIPTLNARMSAAEVRRFCLPDPAADALMRSAFESLGLSARGHDKVLRVARTIADLDGAERIGEEHVAEAIMYRSLDRKYWHK